MSDSRDPEDDAPPPPWAIRLPGLLAGPLAAVVIRSTLGPSADGGDGAVEGALSASGSIVLGLLAWMAIWWLTQAIPIAVTAVLPVAVLPALGVERFADAAQAYASDVIFLFAGGCLLAAAIDRHGLGRRFAGAMLSVAGRRPGAILAAFMLVTAALSAFVSNTATAAIMLPLALGAISFVDRAAPESPDRDRLVRRFALSLLLGVAYAASIGGCATIVGSPPNAIAAKMLSEQAGEPVSFLGWLAFGLPVAALMLPATWLVLLVMFPMGGLSLRADGGPAFEKGPALDRFGWFTLAVFLATVAAWVTRPLWPPSAAAIGDWGIATIAGVLLLGVPLSSSPRGATLAAGDLARLPWGVFILFGGGLAIAASMRSQGVDLFLGSLFDDVAGLPPWIVIGVLVTGVVFLSEVSSNTALASAVVPVVLAAAPVLGLPPAELAFTVGVAASLAFMMPVGTPPNALVYSTGRVPVGAMMRAGLVVNLVGIVLLVVLSRLLL